MAAALRREIELVNFILTGMGVRDKKLLNCGFDGLTAMADVEADDAGRGIAQTRDDQ